MNSQVKKKPGLGRGLSALLEDASNDLPSNINAPIGSVSTIPLNQIEANPFQPRTEFTEVELKELAESIKVHGVIQPITVRKLGFDRFQIISGERRTRASILAGLTQIPAYIRVANDQDMLEMALIENIQRADLNAIEIGMSYKRLLEECKIKQEELGERVGKDRTTVNNYLRLLKLPDSIQLGIKQGLVSMGHARAIINIEDPDVQLELYNQIIENHLNVREIESLAKATKEGKSYDFPKAGTDWDPEIDRITEAFYQKLKSPVHLKHGAKGKGKIIISYKNMEELERILSIIQD